MILRITGDTHSHFERVERKLDDIKAFDVTSADLEERIQIETEKGNYTFIRKDPNQDNIALAMAKIIKESK